MENDNILDTNLNLTPGLLVDSTAKQALSETGSWGKLFAVLLFILSGFMIIAGITMIFFMGSIGGMGSAFAAAGMPGGMMAGMGILYILLALIYIMPGLYLWRFSTKIKSSINTNDQTEFNDAVINLKSCYKFFGILTLIILGIYAAIILFSVIAAVM